MEIFRFGVEKSEIRNPKSERNPKSKIRRGSSHPSRAAVRRCLRGLPGRCRGCLTRRPIDVDFGLRTSGFFRHSDLHHRRRLEMINGSKPGSPSGGPQAPSPKRRRPGLRVSRSPSPQPSPRGEGETFGRALILRYGLVIVCLRNERQRGGDYNRNVRIFQRRASALPLPGGEGWGEGERSNRQSQPHDDSRNCQTSQVPGRAGNFPIWL
jgi:hypothetical protein